jgi:hypothetical protein
MWCSCAHGVPVRGLSLGVNAGVTTDMWNKLFVKIEHSIGRAILLKGFWFATPK